MRDSPIVEDIAALTTAVDNGTKPPVLLVVPELIAVTDAARPGTSVVWVTRLPALQPAQP